MEECGFKDNDING